MSTNTVTNSTLSAARKRDEMLEPYEWKRSRTVLRREGASNRPDLVDQGVFTVVVPKRSQATDEEARARQMPDITWEAQLEGAVHTVKVKGVLRATLSA